ncbi:hypothetical protein PMIN02_010494 [Paraphaeosphaeria minitans]
MKVNSPGYLYHIHTPPLGNTLVHPYSYLNRSLRRVPLIMSDEDADALERLAFAIKNRTSLLANDKPIPSVPVKPVPATPLCRRRLPQRGSFAYLHPTPTEDDLASASQRLRTYRGKLIEEIHDEAAFHRPSGDLKVKFAWRLKAMLTDDNHVLKDPSVGPRRNIDYIPIEDMQAIKEERKNPWGQSSLRHQVQHSADPGAHGEAESRRRVGVQYVKGMLEGDIEQAALQDVKEEIESELEGLV